MQRLGNLVARQGQPIFGIAIAAIGAENLAYAHTSIHFPGPFQTNVVPVLPWVPAYAWVAYLTGALLLAAGLSIMTNVRARIGAIVAGGILLGCDLVLHVARVVAVPGDWGLRGITCEMLALSSAAFVLAASVDRASGGASRSDRTLGNAGRLLFGFTAIVFGVDHFLALDLIASLVPKWMPAHVFFAAATGLALIGAGVSIVTKWMGGWVSLALGTMFLLWVVVLHAPRVLAAPQNPDELSSALIALAMCGASWIVASALLGDRAAI